MEAGNECRLGALGTTSRPRVRRRAGVEWWLLENGTVTQQASAGVSRDTSPSSPHGETPSGAAVHASRKELSGSEPGGSPISRSNRFAGEV